MAVYMVQAGDNGPVKIGLAKDVAKRVQGLQTAQPVKLNILRVLDGGADIEGALHQKFAHLRSAGEWFTFSEDMLGDLGLSDLPPPSKKEVKPAGALDEFRRNCGLTYQQLGNMLGIGGKNPLQTARRYCLHERIPSRPMLRVIERVTDGAVTRDGFPDFPVRT
jgi:hypothetical protein